MYLEKEIVSWSLFMWLNLVFAILSSMCYNFLPHNNTWQVLVKNSYMCCTAQQGCDLETPDLQQDIQDFFLELGIMGMFHSTKISRNSSAKSIGTENSGQPPEVVLYP